MVILLCLVVGPLYSNLASYSNLDLYSILPFYGARALWRARPTARAPQGAIFLKICTVLCFLEVPQKDAGRNIMKIGGSGVPRALTGSRMVTKRIKAK